MSPINSSRRLIRWLLLSLLVLKLGPGAVGVVGDVVHHHLALFLSALTLIFAAIGVWALRKKRKAGEPLLETEIPDDSPQP